MTTFSSGDVKEVPGGVVVDVHGGIGIDLIARESVDYLRSGYAAELQHDKVQFSFNGIPIVVTSADSVGDVCNRYSKACDDASTAYRKTDKYKREAAKQAERDDRDQATINELHKSMAKDFKTQADTIRWLAKFTEVADNNRIVSVVSAVLMALSDAGYKRNDCVGLDKAQYTNPDTMGRWIIGQAMECMSKGLPPHSILLKFAGEYKELIKAEK